MADDSDDDKKEDNKNKGQKEKISDPQALNDIKAILAQIAATNNPAELSRLASAAQNVNSNDPLINDIAAKVAEYALKKQEITEKQLNSEITQKELAELERERQRDEEVIKHKIEVARRIQGVKTLHNEFKEDLEECKKLYPR